MCEIKFHVKLPIFVARQWIRHRTANVNEYSARYSILDKRVLCSRRPSIWRRSRTINRQGRDDALTAAEAAERCWSCCSKDAGAAPTRTTRSC